MYAWPRAISCSHHAGEHECRAPALLKALGAELVLTPARGGDGRARYGGAEQLQAEHPGSFIPDQFGNPANAMAHEKTTGPEILRDLDGEVDFFVAAVGTGGTLTGTGRALKRACPACQVVAVEPAASPLLSQGVAGSHRIQGIGANFVPKVLDRSVIDEIIPVEDDAAFEMSRQLARTEGLLVGISAGAAVWAARALAMRAGKPGKKDCSAVAGYGRTVSLVWFV